MPVARLADGKQLWYRDEGSGPPLLQVHGASLGHHNFDRLTPPLSAHFRCLDVDLLGYGESSPLPAEGYTQEAWADDMAAFLDALGLEKVHVHGTSTGGVTALLLAHRHPQRVDRMVISASTVKMDGAARLNRRHQKRVAREMGMEELALVTAYQALTRDFLDTPEAEAQLERMQQAFAATPVFTWLTMIETLERLDMGDLLYEITTPTLALAAEDDHMNPIETAPSGIGMGEMARRMPNATLKVYPGGHLFLVQRVNEVVQDMVEFLKG